MVKDNTGSERSEFVGELIDLEEAIERLQNAQEVAAALAASNDAKDRKIEALRHEIKKLNQILENITVNQRDIARDLARAGGQTHKDKDEVLLIAIYRLLSIGYAPVIQRNLDDIPWHDDVPF